MHTLQASYGKSALTAHAIQAGIVIAVLLFCGLTEWAVQKTIENDRFNASVRLREAARRLREAADVDRFFDSVGRNPAFSTSDNPLFCALDAALGPRWKERLAGRPGAVRIWRFDSRGRLVEPITTPEETRDVENIWNGAILRCWQEQNIPISRADRDVLKAGLAAAHRMFSPFVDLMDLWHSYTFRTKTVQADGSGSRISLIRDDLEVSDNRSGRMGYFRTDAMDPLFVERRIAGLVRRVAVDFCAIQRGNRMVSPATHRLKGADWRRLGLTPDNGKTTLTPQGSFMAFSLPGGRILALGCRPGAVAAIPVWVRLAAGGCCLFLAGFAGRRIGSIATGREQAGMTLQVRILGMFFLASWIPLGTILCIGVSTAAESAESARRFWNTRLHQRVEREDKMFRNHIESLQSTLRETTDDLSSALSRNRPDEIRAILEDDRKGYYAVCYSADGRVWRREKGRYYSQTFINGIARIGELLFLPVVEAATRIHSLPADANHIRMDAGDLLGEGTPMLDMMRSRGRILQGELFERAVTTFWDLLTDAAGNAIGAVCVVVTPNDEIKRFGKTIIPFEGSSGIQVQMIYDSLFYPDEHNSSPELIRMGIDSIGSRGNIEEMVNVNGVAQLAVLRPSSFISDAAFVGTLPYETVKDTYRHQTWGIFGGVLLALLPVVLAAVMLNRRIAGPVTAISRAGMLVAAGDDRVALPVGGATELSRLAASFNEMVEGLRQRERMRRFLSAAAWESSAGGVSAVRTDVTVLTSDLRGFTTLSERHSAGEMVAMLNEYFTGMERVIRRHGGDVDRFIGDAVTAVFCGGAGEEAADHCRRAVLAAVGMREALARFNAARKAAGRFPVENGIGIDTGVAVRGLVGAAEGRRDLTIVGNVVSGAAECEAASRHGSATKIIVSSAVARLLQSGFTWNRLAVPTPTACFELDRLS
ncbi:MAG TPA: adenylate/guanylate cyclase domain-containing protein [Candidatus Ozemobacteraceae bacterium]|nr:adenylate/guanylate cyclase domain-containing protein [Candidatus Ozemobacteraceae bacterium]